MRDEPLGRALGLQCPLDPAGPRESFRFSPARSMSSGVELSRNLELFVHLNDSTGK
jgi:hypothetical protein